MNNRIQTVWDTLLFSSIQIMLVVAFLVVRILNIAWRLTRAKDTIGEQ